MIKHGRTSLLLAWIWFFGVLTTTGVALAAPKDCGACPNDATRVGRVGLYIAPIQGDGQLGPPISAIIGTQVLQTLQREHSTVPGSDFGCDYVDKISPQAQQCSQLLLSGKVTRLSDAAVLLASLHRLPNHDQRPKYPERWTVNLSGKSVSLDPLKDSYAFAPIIIPRDVISKYTTIDMKLCTHPTLPCAGGAVEWSAIAKLSQENGDLSRGSDSTDEFIEVILYDGTKGWLYVPLIDHLSEPVKFIAGIIGLLRGNYSGAASFFGDIKGSPSDTAFRIDALLYSKRSRRNSLAPLAGLRWRLRRI
jgi:hypothetical protein